MLDGRRGHGSEVLGPHRGSDESRGCLAGANDLEGLREGKIEEQEKMSPPRCGCRLGRSGRLSSSIQIDHVDGEYRLPGAVVFHLEVGGLEPGNGLAVAPDDVDGDLDKCHLGRFADRGPRLLLSESCGDEAENEAKGKGLPHGFASKSGTVLEQPASLSELFRVAVDGCGGREELEAL